MNVASNLVLALACTAALIATAIASPPAHKGTHAVQPATYAGQQSREVTSLSAEDVAALLAGKGWGLAKPAELTGYPGPLHVLELATELKLDEVQRKGVQGSFDRMQARAMDLGARYVAAERAIDEAFRKGGIREELAERVAAAERLRTQLRLAHLEAHLEVTPLLKPEQLKRYAELRGYTGGHSAHGQHKH